jgi:hypothetical protein
MERETESKNNKLVSVVEFRRTVSVGFINTLHEIFNFASRLCNPYLHSRTQNESCLQFWRRCDEKMTDFSCVSVSDAVVSQTQSRGAEAL